VRAVFRTDHLDCPPLGDIAQVIALLIQGNAALDFTYRHTTPKGQAELLTAELRQVLGEELTLDMPEIFLWIRDYLKEQEAQLEGADTIL